MSEERTDFVMLTPPGAGGVAVVEIVGAGRQRAAERLLRNDRGGPWRCDGGGAPRLARLAPDGRDLDEVLVVERPERASIELQIHGSPAVLDALAGSVDLQWRRPANGAADQLLRHALSEAQLALAIEQQAFDWPNWIRKLARLDADRRAAELTAALERSRIARALAEPCAVALVGARNAGKSSLLNRLLFSERVLTGALPGLTRDPVADQTVLDGYPYQLIDTAGVGDTDDPLEQLAIERGREQHSGALLVLVVDGQKGFGEWDRALLGRASLVIRNKVDLPQASGWPAGLETVVELSCVEGAASAAIRARVGEALRRLRGLPDCPRDGVGGPSALDAAQQAELEALI